MTKFDHYLTLVEGRRAEHPEWREGQAHFNVLYFDGYDPTLADELRGGPLDPFHRDAVLPEFLDAVRERWAA